MEKINKMVDGWTGTEYDVIQSFIAGLNGRNIPLVLETYQADDGTPIATFCCCSTGEAFYSITKINRVYVVSNFCGPTLEGSDLYRTMSNMLMPQGWVAAVQKVNQL